MPLLPRKGATSRGETIACSSIALLTRSAVPSSEMLAQGAFAVNEFTWSILSGEKATRQQSSKTPIVNLRGNQIFFNDKPVTMPELEARLQVLNLAEADGNAKVIMLESTRDTPYQSYFQAMATISEQGGVIAIVEEE